VRQWLRSRPGPAEELIEPFAGGAIVALSAVFDGLARRATLVELDAEVAAVWETILGEDGQQLAEAVRAFCPTPAELQRVTNDGSQSPFHLALATLLRNRTRRGGILAPGASVMKQGENGKGLFSRWYPDTLHARILALAARRDQIRVFRTDGLQYLRENQARPEAVFFIDPPYVRAGARLYTHSEIDHPALFAVAAGLQGGWLMTYDDTDDIRRLAARHGFQTRSVPMKNTHHARKRELLIGRCLRWMDDPGREP
jgi:DNA adenine methylase